MATARQKSALDAQAAKDSRWHEVINGNAAGLEICHVEGIGRGIRTTRPFKQGEYLLRYFGELISPAELKRREKRGPKRGHFYRYVFRLHETPYVIDATREDGSFGRLINHSRKKPNILAKPFEIGGVPSVVFVAHVDLASGVELRYDYGERDPQVILENPWLKR